MKYQTATQQAASEWAAQMLHITLWATYLNPYVVKPLDPALFHTPNTTPSVPQAPPADVRCTLCQGKSCGCRPILSA